MTDRELDHRLREWLATRDPGPAPSTLFTAAARVPYSVRPSTPWQIADAIATRWAVPHPHTIAALRLVAALALLLLAVAAAAVFVGGRHPDANDLVRLSRAAHQNPPPFTMTTTVYDRPGDNMTFHGCDSIWLDEDTITVMQLRYAWDGAGHFRQECHYTGSVPGYPATLDDAFIVLGPDGSGGVWTGDTWTDARHQARPAGASVATVDWLNWVHYTADAAPTSASPPTRCVWTLASGDVIAGHETHAVTCGSDTVWIDADTYLILKRSHGGEVLSEALAFDVGNAPSADLFEIRPPVNARQRLVDGQIPVSWTLPQPGGGSLDWSSLGGKPTVVLTRTDNCPRPCLGLTMFVEAVRPRLGTVNAVGYATWTANDVSITDPLEIATTVGFTGDELRRAQSAGVPVVADDGRIAPAWEVWTGVELFDAAGRHVATRDPRSVGSLSAMIDALVRGDPIPERPPGDGVFFVGSRPPPMVAQLLGGGTLDLAELRGRPVAILSPGWLGPSTAAVFTDLVAVFADACGTDIVCVVLPSPGPFGGDPLEGWAGLAAQLESQAHDVGSLVIAAFPDQSSWRSLLAPGLGYDGGRRALVALDSEGAIVRVEGEPEDDIAALRQQLLEGQP